MTMLNYRAKRRECDGEDCSEVILPNLEDGEQEISTHRRRSKFRTARRFEIMDVTSEVIRDYHQFSPSGEVQHASSTGKPITSQNRRCPPSPQP
ncbi:hypothetical protein V1506DRAFT_545406 [Lipomyces tetrasporus]